METLQVRLSTPPLPPDIPAPTGPDTGLRQRLERPRRSDFKRPVRRSSRELRAQLGAPAQSVCERPYKPSSKPRWPTPVSARRTLSFRRRSKRSTTSSSADLEKYELAVMAEYQIPLANLRRERATWWARPMKRKQSRSRPRRSRSTKSTMTRLETPSRRAREAVSGPPARQDRGVRGRVQDSRRLDLKRKYNDRVEAREAEPQAEFQQPCGRGRPRSRPRWRNGSGSRCRPRSPRNKTDVAQIKAAQIRYAKQVEAEAARIHAELQALAAQRLRLEDSVSGDQDRGCNGRAGTPRGRSGRPCRHVSGSHRSYQRLDRATRERL